MYTNLKPVIWRVLGLMSCFLILGLFSQEVLAAESTKGSWGGVAASITSTFGEIGKLISAASYLAGLGFSIGAIMKFKQHKDNPSQTPIGTPIALVFIAAALLFLPSFIEATGKTAFEEGAKTAGPEGCVIKKGQSTCQ